jgi:phospholipid/cholesterol/gamma-HCH transport system substrate-binding protein
VKRAFAAGGLRRRGLLLRAGALAGASALGLAACSGGAGGGGGGGGSYNFTAELASGQGLFSGSHLQVLGLTEGTVTSVRNVGDHVVVGLSLPSSVAVPADVHAIVVAPELLGQRSVDLEPGYSGGPRLANGAVIPQARTAVPAETNTVLRELTSYLSQLNPQSVHDLVVNLSQDLNGQGQALNSLIGHAAGTIQLLADKGNQLGQLDGSLAQLTGSLDSRSSAIEALIRDYDGVSGVIATDRVQLDGAIQALSNASTQLTSFLSPNLAPLEKDIGALTTVGRTLDRNLGSVDQILSSSADLFAGTGRAVDPQHAWLVLNNQAPPGTTGMVVADELRDRLAGICRRVLANHSAGLPANTIQTLRTCGNPASGFFNSVLGLIPQVLDSLSGAQTNSASSAQQVQQQQQAFGQALSMIPGISPTQRSQLSNPTVSPTQSSSSGTGASAPPSSLLAPLSPAPSSGSGSHTGSHTGSSGVTGLVLGGFTSFAHRLSHLWSWL